MVYFAPHFLCSEVICVYVRMCLYVCRCVKVCVYMHRHQRLKLHLPQLWYLHLISLLMCSLYARCMCVGTHVAVYVYRAETNFVEFIIFSFLLYLAPGIQLRLPDLCSKGLYYSYFSWGRVSPLWSRGWYVNQAGIELTEVLPLPSRAGIKSLCPQYVAWSCF